LEVDVLLDETQDWSSPMATTKSDIRRWFDNMKGVGYDYMLVYCDTFDHEDYPVGRCRDGYWAKRAELDQASMQRFMESYDLSAPIEPQLDVSRVDRHPPKPVE